MTQIKEFADYRNISLEDASYITRKSSFLCKCGGFKMVRQSVQSRVGKVLGPTCGRRECSAVFGRKRPEHSRLMKEMSKSGPASFRSNLIKPGQLFNTEVNSLEFKKKVLSTRGVEIENDDVLATFSKHASDLLKSTSTRRKQIIDRYNKWEPEYQELILLVTGGIVPTEDWVNSLTLENMQYIWARIHGINTIRNGIKVARPGWFKRILKTDFKYNTQNLDKIITRSGLESDYIDYFEKNAIPWSYEKHVIETVRHDGFHIPDFEIFYNTEKILLEVKGTFYRHDKEDYIANKVMAAMSFAKENNMRYILTQDRKSVV